jgi:hypothetical protein
VAGQGHLNRLVSGTGNLEEDLVLTLEADLAVIQTPGGDHGPIKPE